MLMPFLLAALLAIAPPGLVGLVEIPSVLGDPEVATQGSVTLRTEPSTTAPVACVVRAAADLETREHGYEELSGVVYDSRPGWYGLRCRGVDGLAWLAASDAGTFRRMDELLKDGLAYLTAEWDRALYQRPRRTAAAHRVRVESREPDITVADTTIVDDELWLLVVVHGEGRCTAEEPGPVVDAGWTPAHTRNGDVTAWFHSRGS
jgi:hypothetical protein